MQKRSPNRSVATAGGMEARHVGVDRVNATSVGVMFA